MLYIGKNRAEAIDAIQDMLGPQTPRSIAEDTYTHLVTEGKVDVDLDCVLLSEDIDHEMIHRHALNAITGKGLQHMARRRLHHRGRGVRNLHERVTDKSADPTGRRLNNDDQ